MTRPVLDTTTYIWDYYFSARVPQLDSTSLDYLRMYGSYTTMDRDIDQTLSNQWLTTMMNINQMVDYFKDGVQIRIVREEDIKTIYEYISLHLEAWRERLTRGINIGDAPIDDLIAMDSFANVVYVHAKHQFTREMVDSLFANALSNTISLNHTNFFNSNVKTPERIDIGTGGRITVDAEPEPQRDTSLADFLKNRLVRLR